MDILDNRDIAVLCGNENILLAHVFKHCGLKTNDFKPLKRSEQRMRMHFSISERLCSEHCQRGARTGRRCSEHGSIKQFLLLLYRP